MTLEPKARNDAFVAVQAALTAITKDDSLAAKGCIKIALAEITSWDRAKRTGSSKRRVARDWVA